MSRGTVDAAPVRERLDLLLAEYGHTRRSLSRASHCTWHQINKIVNGERTRISPKTAARIMRIPLVPVYKANSPHPGEHVSALGTVRRLRALAVMGFTAEQIAGRCPTLKAVTIRAIQRRAPRRVAWLTHREVDHAYRSMSSMTPTGSYAEHVRTLARTRGWYGPGEWDDPDTDPEPEPEYQPIVDLVRQRPGIGATSLGRELIAEGMHAVDFRALLVEAIEAGAVIEKQWGSGVQLYPPKGGDE